MPPQETLKHSKAGLAQSLVGVTAPFWVTGSLHQDPLVLVCTRFCLHLLSVWQVCDLILNQIAPFLLPCWGFSFAAGRGVYFLSGIRPFPVDGCPAASCDFGVPAGEDEHISFYSAILGDIHTFSVATIFH